MQKCNGNKEQCGKKEQIFKSFDKLYRKSLQNNLIDGKNKRESLCNNFTKCLDETKRILLMSYKHLKKFKFFQ